MQKEEVVEQDHLGTLEGHRGQYCRTVEQQCCLEAFPSCTVKSEKVTGLNVSALEE